MCQLGKQGEDRKKLKIFQIYGLDILIDSQLKGWVLEINDNPSFDIFYSQEYISMTKKGEEDICPVDRYVKSRVIRDAVNLMRSKHYISESI